MIWSDLKQALRALLRRPAFLMLGVLALGLGLAGSALVFSLANTFLLRSLPGVHASRPLLELGRVNEGDTHFDSFSFPEFSDLREQAESLDRVFAFRYASAYVQRRDKAEAAVAGLVSGDYFEVLGVRASEGSLIGRQHDAAPGASPVAVLSHAAYQRWFDADPRQLGQVVKINGSDYTLLGVTDPEFRGHEAGFTPDIYLPLAMTAEMNVHPDSIRSSRGSRWLRVGARLAPGSSLQQVQAELDAFAARLQKAYPDSNTEVGFGAAPMRPVSNSAWEMIMSLATALFALCAAVLLLACFNLAGVLLAQGQARRPEFAMRMALGAGAGRLLREVLLECLIVGASAGALGLLLAWAGRHLLTALPLPMSVPLDLSLAMDWRVIVCTLALAMLVSLLFGFGPAWRLSRIGGRHTVLREASDARAPRQHGRRLLIGVQAALTIALLLFAALVLRSVQQATTADTGFRTQRVSLSNFDVEPLGIEAGDGAARMERVAAALRAQPGVHGAGFASMVPLSMSSLGFGSAYLPGQDGDGERLDVNTVGEGFLDAVGVPVRGRGILRSDVADSERVAVINARLAKQLFGDADPIGRRFELGDADERDPVLVVGVVPDGRYSSLSESPRSFAFLAAPQWERGEFTLFVHSDLPPADLHALVRKQAALEFPGLPAPLLESFERSARLSILPQLILSAAASALGGFALILAGTGLYGVLAFQVANRAREFGVRMALGARGARIASQVARGLLWWVLPGVLVGMLLGQGAARLVGQFLSGLGGFDPLATLAVLGTFASMAAVAAGAPLARILQLRPSDALRSE